MAWSSPSILYGASYVTWCMLHVLWDTASGTVAAKGCVCVLIKSWTPPEIRSCPSNWFGAISTQVFLVFLGPRRKCWDGSHFSSKLPLHASHVALPTYIWIINLHSPCICNMLNDHCHRVSTHLQSINIIIIIISGLDLRPQFLTTRPQGCEEKEVMDAKEPVD